MEIVSSMQDPLDPLERLEEEQRQPAATRVEFQQQLARAEGALVGLGGQVASAIVPVTTAFLEANEHAADIATTRDDDIDHRCRRLEESCYVLIARQAPVGGDLRRIVGVVRSVADVQRSSNLLGHVASSLTWVHPPAMSAEVQRLVEQLGAVSAEIFEGAIQAWRTHDPLAATELAVRDDQVDLLQKCLLTEIYTGQQSVEEAVSLALIGRYYERIADHGVEMARQVAYAVTGERVA
jgi:phosphate transport system protein